MRIGFDVTSLSVPRSGVGTYTLNLLKELLAQEDDEILALHHRAVCDPAGLRGCGVPISAPVHPPLNKTIWMQAVLPWQLARQRVEVSHFTNSVAPLFSPCATIVTIHDMTLWLYPQYHYRRRLLAMRPFIPLVAKRAATVIAVSESAKADIVDLLAIPAEKVRVIYEAPASAFQPLQDHGRLSSAQSRYGLPASFFLYVGTIEPRKNLVRLLSAFAEVKRRHRIPQSLVLVGYRGWKSDPVFETVERLGLEQQVRFLSHVPETELVAIYNLADVLLFPSLYEGFGLPVVEAMACGIPVLTSARGSLGEISADAAYIVDPLNADEMVRGMHRLATDKELREELRTRGLVRAAYFTWQRAAAQTRAVYSETRRGSLAETGITGLDMPG